MSVLVGRRAMLAVALWLLCTSVVGRTLGLYPAVLLSRGDGLAMGSILAFLLEDWTRTGYASAWIGRLLILLGVVSIAWLSWFKSSLYDPMQDMAGCRPFAILFVNLFYCCIVGMIVLHTGHPFLSVLRLRAVRYLGEISHGVFLFHPLVIGVFRSAFEFSGVVSYVVCIGVSLLVGMICLEFIEKPIGGLKRYFEYRT
jgi:peptidoglycan/LPS O-acetylase OafA/YrhL